jgi:hypothetical protein
MICNVLGLSLSCNSAAEGRKNKLSLVYYFKNAKHATNHMQDKLVEQ